ncbi:InlB B-repeat-containing protein [Tepidanaerobacter syntrophicus]|uniref:InlB B-repeat-containing protein n=1 Tax=Tepidanaerobacter syntrophicus TaxID=224999 RepID=UPI001BD51CAD|nr:InlB B-repeat-containing protein [Tepidanaerobacter syntrophicus]
MKRLKRVFTCFLCILLILTQPISTLALEEAISEIEKDTKYCETEEFNEYKSDNSKIKNSEEIDNILEPGESQDIIDDKTKENERLDNLNEPDDSDKIEEPAESIKQDDSEETKENEGMSDEEESERDVELEDPIEDNITDKEQNKEEQELSTENEETDGNEKTNEGEELSEDEEVIDNDEILKEEPNEDEESTEADKTDHINWYLKQGENASEYQISNAKELLGLAELVNGTAKDAEDKLIAAVDFSGKCITLTDDIDLSEMCHPAVTGAKTDPEVEEVSWQPIGTSNTQFKGVFDGGGHTISGLYINSNKTHLGLFGYINDAKIQNLTVEGSVKYTGTAWSSYVSGVAAYVAGTCELEGLTSNVALDNPSDNTGGIAAYMSGASKISRCINHGVIHSDDSYVGGILGRGNSSDAVISNCYVTADIKGKYDTGAIVGRFSTSATLRDCFYYNPGGGMSIADSGSPVNCYYLSDASIEGAKGVAKGKEAFRYGEVAYLLNGRSAHRSNWAQGKDYPIFGDENTEPLYRVSIAPHAKDSIITFEFIDLDESLHPISEGNGGKSLYVPKDTRISIKFSGGTPCLMPEGICIPAESQVGVYYIEVSGEDAVITYGTAEELTQPTLSWYSKDEVTFFINFEPELRGLELLVNSEDPELKDNFSGKTVILGRNIELHGDWKPIGTGSDKPFKGTFDGNGHSISGLKIGSSAKDGAVEGNYQGFFGYTQGTIKDLTVTGSVYGKGDYIGGIAGYSTGTIDKCSFGEDGGSSDYISGGNYVGGVVGYASGSITSSSNSGKVTGKEFVGGIAGCASSTSKDRVKNNFNSGHISGNKDVGGIVGHSKGGVSGNKNSGNVQGFTNIDSNIGGIVGFSNRTYAGYLLQNTNTGEIKGEGNNIGGIAGYTRGPISGGANSGDITGNSNVGGIVGNLENKTEVLNSYSTGKVTVTNEDGKYGLLVGADSNGSSIKNSYSYNTEEPHISFSGSENTAVIDSYYLVSDVYDGDDKAAKTAEQFKNGEVAWLLDGGENTRETTAWTQDDGGNYPVLGEKPIFRIKIAEGESVKGCSLMIGAGGLTEPLTYVEMNPENPSETCEWKLVYVRSEEELHFTTHIDKDYEVVFTPPLELKKTDKDYILKVDRNYIGHYTFGVIVLPDYSWYSGPEAKEYTLSNEAHLVALGELVNGTAVIDGKNIPAVDFAGKVIHLGDNINIKAGNWKAIGKKDTPFKGIFDGQTHSISSLNINAVSDNQGLFGYIEDATIKNLSVNGVVNSTGKNIGGIAGFASGKCRFENLSFGSGVIGGNSELHGEGSDAGDVTGEESSNEDFGENDENKPNEGELAEDNFDKEELGEGNISEEVLTEASADEAPSRNDESKPTQESSSEKESGEGKEPGNENSEEPRGEIPENPGNDNEDGNKNKDDNENGNTEPVKASSVSGAKAIGGILGAGMFSENSTDESMTFINCINHGAISGTDTETGGIVGYIYHSSDKKNAKIVLKDCKNDGTIEGCGDYTAGIVARVGSGSKQYLITEITNCSNDGSVSGKGQYTAGVAGYVVSSGEESASKNSSISACVNNGTIIGNDSYVAGVAAYILNYVEVINCSNTGKIEDNSSYNSYTGGVLGYAKDGADIVRCYNRGAVTGKDSYTGGVAGSLGSNTSIRDCKNEGKVVGKDYTGGISGHFTGRKLERCCNQCEVEGTDRTGGVVGCFKGDKPLSVCFNDGDIRGTDSIGGIVGKVETSGKGIVISCYNTGSISGTGSSAKAGGIIGENHFSRSGGSFGIPIVSKTESGASNCYNHGKVVSSGKLGAITAAYYNMNDNCYYRKDSVSNPVDYKNATAITEDGLASGKVAWILNGGAGKRIDGWSQREGFPVIAGPKDGPTYRISIKASQHGKVADSSLARELYANAGDEVKLSITPEEGYLLKLLTVDGYDTGKNYFSISNTEEIEFEMPLEDVIITPIFGLRGLKDEYTVTFYVDGEEKYVQTVKNGGTATEPVEPSKEGYDFDGWYTDEAGGQKWNFATAVTEDVKLYAHWRVAGMVEVTFDANGGHFSDDSETTVINIKSGGKITFPEEPERNDVSDEGDIYIFNGWYSDRLGENKVDETYIVTEDMTCYANWNTVDKFSLGTEEEPFVISSPDVLRELAARVNSGNAYENCYFQLEKDANWVLTDWTPIGETSEFRGNFDGNGVTIKLKGSAGLFGILTKVKIKNFTLEADIHGGNNTGAVASTVLGQKAREFSEFKDITVRGKVSGTKDVGGFVGLINANYWSSYYENSVSFENCHNKSKVTGNGNRVGGFVGTHYSHSIYRECSNSGEVTGASGVGGLDGYAMYVTIEDTHNTGKIVGSGDNVGGLIGAMGVGIYSGEQPMNAIFTNSYNTGNIEGNNNIGGLFGGAGLVGYGNAYGDNTGTLIQFTQCYNTGSITGTNRVAGIVGYMNPFKNAVLEECYNNGEISGKDYTAGIFGDIAQGAIAVKDCYNEGKIIGNDYAAGIFGRSSRGGSTVEDCYNIGSVEGAKYTAGIFGYSNSVDTTVQDSYNIGNIKGTQYAAGIFGYSNGIDTTVKDCYNRGNISGSEYVAGIYGCIEEGSSSNETTAIYCYTSGKIKGAGGAIAGGNYEKNANCYYMEGNIKNPADAKYAIAETAEDFLLGEVAYLLDGCEGERRGKWTQDKEVDLPKLGTPPYYKIELESNEGGCIDIDGHTKMFAPSGEVIKINAICQDHPKNDDSGEMQYKYILESLTVSFAKGEELDITDNKSFTMLSSDAKVTAVFKPQEVAPIEPPIPEPTPEPEKPQEPEKGIGGGDGTGTGRGKGKKTGDGYGDGGGNGDSDDGSTGNSEGKGDPMGDGTSEIEAVESVKTDTTIITPPSAPKVTSNDIDTVPPVNIVADVKQSHNDQAGQEYNKSSKSETDSLTASGSPGPDFDANEPKELEEEEEEKIKVFEIVKKVMHENPILVVIVIASIIGLLFSGGLRAYSTIKRRR